MLPLITLTFIDLFTVVFNTLILARIIVSYLMKPGNRAYLYLVDLTEPILGPVRKLLPMTGVDLAPLATFFLLGLVQFMAHLLIKV